MSCFAAVAVCGASLSLLSTIPDQSPTPPLSVQPTINAVGEDAFETEATNCGDKTMYTRQGATNNFVANGKTLTKGW